MDDAENISTWDFSSVGIIGGEPFLRDDLKQFIEKLLDGNNKRTVTIYTNGIVLAKHPEKIILGDNINYMVSIDGWKGFHEYLRGKGTFNLAMSCVELLTKNLEDIGSVWIRTTYSKDNLADIYRLKRKADELGIKMMLYPLLGSRPPLPTKIQLDLFRWAGETDNVIVYLPSFWQWCGYEQSTCQAGKYRLAINSFGNVMPCQWMDSEYLGSIYRDEFETLRERGMEWRKNYVDIRPSCMGCPRATECRGSCRLCVDYLTCPLRRELTVDKFYVGKKLKLIKNKYTRSVGKLKIVGC